MGVNNLFHSPFHFEFYVSFVLLNEVFEQYLNYRQYVFIKRNVSGDKSYLDNKKKSDKYYKKALDSLKSYLDSSEYKKTLDYSLDKMKFSVFTSVFETVLGLVLLFALFSPKLWNLSGKLFKKNNEYVQSLTFSAAKLLLDTVIELPFSLYKDFVLEEKHGFNKKTYKLFFKDLALMLLLECLIGGPVMCVVIFLVHWGGELFYLYVFGFVVVFTFVMLVVYPELIAPLFNKFEPLKDEELKEQVENLAKSLNFPLREIKQMDKSKRSSHSNAYLYGLWKFKKVVIHDTLLKMERKQILAVISHEFGHWKHNHWIKTISFSFANIFALFFLFKLYKDDQNMYNSFGFYNVNAFVIGLTLFSNLFTVVGVVTNLITVTMSRYHEYQADKFSVKLGFGEELASSLLDLSKDNKSLVYNDPLYSWYHFTHPVVFDRNYAIYRAMDESNQ